MAPDEKALRADVAKPAFRAGAAEKRWQLLDIVWPHVFIAVTAKDAHVYTFRFDCTGFPASPPTAGAGPLRTPLRGAGTRPAATF